MATKQIDGRRKRGLANKQAIVEAARVIFQESKYRNITMRQINKRAGVGYGTLYSHFNGKDDILKYLITEITADFDKVLYLPYEPLSVAEAEKRIAEDIRYLLRLAKKHKLILRVAHEAMGQSENIKQFWDSIFNKYINKAMEDYYYSFKKGLTKTNLSLNVVSKAIVYLMSDFFWDVVLDKEEDIETTSKDLATLFLHGSYRADF